MTTSNMNVIVMRIGVDTDTREDWWYIQHLEVGHIRKLINVMLKTHMEFEVAPMSGVFYWTFRCQKAALTKELLQAIVGSSWEVR